MELTDLILIIKILLVLLVLLWMVIAYSLFYRERRTRHLQRIEVTFANITSKYLYPLPGELHDLIEVQRAFRRLGIKK